MKHTKVMKTWGFEIIFENDKENDYCGKLLVCFQNKWSSEGKWHYHKIKTETFYVIKGILILEVVKEGEVKEMFLNVGESYQIKPNEPHRFKSMTDICKFIEASTYDSPEDSYRIERYVWDYENQNLIEKEEFKSLIYGLKEK